MASIEEIQALNNVILGKLDSRWDGGSWAIPVDFSIPVRNDQPYTGTQITSGAFKCDNLPIPTNSWILRLTGDVTTRQLTDLVNYGTNTPTTPVTGGVWYDTTNLKQYSGTSWVTITTGAGGTHTHSYTDINDVVGSRVVGRYSTNDGAAQMIGLTGGIEISGTNIQHVTGSPYNHIPASGTTNQILKCSATAGQAAWGTVTENSGALAAITTINMTGQLTNSLASGTMPFVVTSTTKSTNLNADLLDDAHVGTSGAAIPLLNAVNTWTASQNFGAGLSANVMTLSSQMTLSYAGTSPAFIITSTVMNTNLNADMVDGVHASNIPSSYTHTHAYTYVTSIDGSRLVGRITTTSGAAELISLGTGVEFSGTTLRHATGSPYNHIPASGTTNQILKCSATAGQAAWGTVTENSGALAAITTINMTGQLTNSLATGTMPFVVTSTTKSTNLNADLLDDAHVGTSGAAIPLLNASNTWGASQAFTAGLSANIMTLSSQMTVTYNSGTNPPFIVTSTAANTNFNADMVDGYHATNLASAAHTHSYESTSVAHYIYGTPSGTNRELTVSTLGMLKLDTTSVTNQGVLTIDFTQASLPEATSVATNDRLGLYSSGSVENRWVSVNTLLSGISGSGDSITIGGSAVTDANFNDTTPTFATNVVGINWQKDTNSPANISACIPFSEIDHTQLANLTNDSHTQYFLASGGRALSGSVDIGGTSRDFVYGTNKVVNFLSSGSAIDGYLSIRGSTGTTPNISVLGTSTDVNLNLIPKGDGVLTVGGVALTGTDDKLVTKFRTKSHIVYLENPTTSDFVPICYCADASTIQALRAITDAGTVKFNISERPATSVFVATQGTNIDSTDFTANTTGIAQTTYTDFENYAIAADSYLVFQAVTGGSGAAKFCCQIEYTID